jgi:hypothetical protein
MWTTQAGVAHRVHSSQQQTQKIATASIRSKEQPALPRCSELSSKHPQIPPRRQLSQLRRKAIMDEEALNASVRKFLKKLGGSRSPHPSKPKSRRLEVAGWRPVSAGPKPRAQRRGRPATGKDPLVSARLPPALVAEVEAWATTNAASRSEAIRRLVELGLKAKK